MVLPTFQYNKTSDGVAIAMSPIAFAITTGKSIVPQHFSTTFSTPPGLTSSCLFVYLDPNSHYAEHSGYFEKTKFIASAKAASGAITFYDSNTGKPLFTSPKGRSMEQFLVESRRHGELSVLLMFCFC